MSSRNELLAAVLDRLELWFCLLEDETPGELQDQSYVSRGTQDMFRMQAALTERARIWGVWTWDWEIGNPASSAIDRPKYHAWLGLGGSQGEDGI